MVLLIEGHGSYPARWVVSKIKFAGEIIRITLHVLIRLRLSTCTTKLSSQEPCRKLVRLKVCGAALPGNGVLDA